MAFGTPQRRRIDYLISIHLGLVVPHPWSGEDRVWRLLAPRGEKLSIIAECLFVDPVTDIAVLGSPDNQSLPDEAEAYERFAEARDGSGHRRPASKNVCGIERLAALLVPMFGELSRRWSPWVKRCGPKNRCGHVRLTDTCIERIRHWAYAWSSRNTWAAPQAKTRWLATVKRQRAALMRSLQ